MAKRQAEIVPITLVRTDNGSGTQTNNWLSELGTGAVFLASDRQGVGIKLDEYIVVSSLDDARAVCLTEVINEGEDDKSLTYWVNPDTFSAKYRLFEILEEGVKK